MGNTQADLTDHLFAQLDRLSDGKLKPDEIEQEVMRTEAIVAVADKIVSNADLQLKAAKLFAEHGRGVLPHLPMIGGNSE